MALDDYMITERRILEILSVAGRKERNLIRDVINPGEDEEEIKSLLFEMEEKKHSIKHYMGTWFIPGIKETRDGEANPWVWYLWLQESIELRAALKRQFTRRDGEIFKAMGALLLNEKRPRLTRTAGEMTEEEFNYIAEVNAKLQAFLRQ